mmetsp:Transcript_65247/g.129115  ORF Transcript_65247/g.129115 Transcript_65247/m.129115 type:complete len:201 (-) Transcript_65247:71-673(-)
MPTLAAWTRRGASTALASVSSRTGARTRASGCTVCSTGAACTAGRGGTRMRAAGRTARRKAPVWRPSLTEGDSRAPWRTTSARGSAASSTPLATRTRACSPKASRSQACGGTRVARCACAAGSSTSKSHAPSPWARASSGVSTGPRHGVCSMVRSWRRCRWPRRMRLLSACAMDSMSCFRWCHPRGSRREQAMSLPTQKA